MLFFQVKNFERFFQKTFFIFLKIKQSEIKMRKVKIFSMICSPKKFRKVFQKKIFFSLIFTKSMEKILDPSLWKKSSL